jgi:transcriptional regulator with XRE-family HTH domain
MLGETLSAIRRFHSLTLTEAASQLDIAKSYLSEVENGKKEPSLAVLKKMSEVYKIPVSHIMFFAENYKPNESPTSKRTRNLLASGWLKILESLAE